MNIRELPKWVIPAAAAGGAFVIGGVVGTLLERRRYRVVPEEPTQLAFTFEDTEFDREMNKAVYTIRKMRDESENLMGHIRDIARLQGIPVSPSRENHPSNERPRPEHIVLATPIVEEIQDAEVVHIFQEEDEDWDYEVELSHRDPRTPYVLHRDEYFNDEMGYGARGDQRTLTWYAGDQVLTDEKDIPIYNASERVGDLRFGHGSGNQNIVYIRNEAEGEEYEVILDDGSYEVVVEGGQVEATMAQEDLRHSRSPGKFRRDD